MSIRLRLTLVYSAILALTLGVLGGMLYGTQLRSMRVADERLLAGMARLTIDRLRMEEPLPRELRPPAWPDPEGHGGSRRFGIPATYWQVSTADGLIVHRSPDLEEVTLPLSARATRALARGDTWIEPVTLGADRLLVYSAPVSSEGGSVQIVQVAHSVSDQEQYLATMARNLLLGGGVAVVVAFACGWVLAGFVLRPVDQIRQTAQQIGADRDFARRVQYTGPEDEIGQLAATVNTMLEELEAAYLQQQQFVADVSHELRTPLTTVRGNLELLQRDPPVSEEDRREVLADLAAESERLIRLVTDLLMLARAEARHPLRCEAVNLRTLVDDVLRQARLIDPTRSIVCDGVPDVGVLGDSDGLKQVVLILVDNAIKHTSGPIGIEATVKGARAALRIVDSGPGIPPAELPHVFERFYRGRAGLSGEAVGLGLGLSIAKALVEAQNGTLDVESDCARGSVFTVTLPLVVG